MTPFSIAPTSTDGLRARIRQVVEWFGGGAISDEDADAAAGVLYGTPPETPASEDGLRKALGRAITAGWTADSIDEALYATDPVFHAVAYSMRRALTHGPLETLPEAVDYLNVRRWPSGFTASVSLAGYIGEASDRRKYWQDAVLEALDRANEARLAAKRPAEPEDKP